ncbi:MAG: class I SAM-dependent methyltransferase [Acidobacteriota bacterium]
MQVPDRVRERLERSCELPFSLLSPAPDVSDGAILPLTSFRHDPLGLAVVDRGAQCWRVMSRRPEAGEGIDAAWADGRLRDAAAVRAPYGIDGPGQAYRLLNGAGDFTPGVLADVYGSCAVVSALSEAMVPVARLLGNALLELDVVTGVVLKRRARGHAAAGPNVLAILGAAPPERLIVSEGAWRFEVHLTTGVNVGLFTDMRLERTRIAGIARERRVLNLFAYTGALSVAALGGGAAVVTSVDLSEGVLAWSRDHMALNQLPADRHETVAADVPGYLEDAVARGAQFDLVLIDPPSVSTARAAGFAIGRDYATLMTAACRVLAPGGVLWLATNTRGFSLVGAAQLAAGAAGRAARVVAMGGLPPDYPTELSDADARYLQTCLLRLT